VSNRMGQAQREWPVAQTSEIPPGGRKIVEVEGRSIGVFNVHGTFVAVLNVCPHELAPVCLGAVKGTVLASMPGEYQWVREGEILACPWHGWEFDLLTGRALADMRKRLRLYPVVVREDTVHILV
jgi:nitrite reductase/ring-hydroxylating ferredoxin subunit